MLKIIRYLIKISGQILFVIGLVLNILMIFFGFWPSLIYLLIMLVGAGMISFNKNVHVKMPSTENIANSLRKLFSSWHSIKVDTKIINVIVKTTLLTFVALAIIIVFTIWLTQDYIKRRDTINDCKEITTALNDFYSKKNRYPDSLSVIIDNNPLRQNWNKDSWGSIYFYRAAGNGKSFTLISQGKDRKLNTKDDMIFNH